MKRIVEKNVGDTDFSHLDEADVDDSGDALEQILSNTNIDLSPKSISQYAETYSACVSDCHFLSQVAEDIR
jgi:hypothetical protein